MLSCNQLIICYFSVNNCYFGLCQDLNYIRFWDLSGDDRNNGFSIDSCIKTKGFSNEKDRLRENVSPLSSGYRFCTSVGPTFVIFLCTSKAIPPVTF